MPDRPGLPAWLRLRYREQATWRELGLTGLAAFVLWPIDLVVVGCALAVPGYLLAALPLLLLDGEQVNVLKLWQVHSLPVAALFGVGGALLFPLLAYPLTAVAAAGRRWSGWWRGRAGRSDGSANWSAPGPGWWMPSRRSGAGSSVICTTVPSSAWSR